ncbi:MAG TPA: amidohydrolase family protein [Chthoniobacteraceae bacterium]|nr:amidohydrolase family protein [Chthoniobacteraceae bacterium]
MKIIDIHIHPRHADLATASGREMADIMTGRMDRAGIAICGILGTVQPYQDAASVRAGNDYTRETVAAAPDRLYGLCFANPLLSPAEVRDELDRCLEQPEFRGIKLERDVNSRDARMEVVMEAAIRHNVPVLHHSWYVNTWTLDEAALHSQAGRSEPHDIAALARRFPEAKIVMAHLEGCGVRGILDVADLENVWIDTSGAQPFTGTLEYAVATVGSSRILYGSDLFGRGTESQLGRILGTPLAPEDRDNILYRNAEALYGLKAFDVPSASTQPLLFQ